MTSKPRLKRPAGQQTRSDRRLRRVAATVPPVSGLPEELYNAYGASLGWKGAYGATLKKWHQLAAVQRTAWRAVFDFVSIKYMAGEYIAVPRPVPGMVAIVVSDGNAYGVQQLPRELLADRDQTARAVNDIALPALADYIDSLYRDNPQQERPK